MGDFHGFDGSKEKLKPRERFRSFRTRNLLGMGLEELRLASLNRAIKECSS